MTPTVARVAVRLPLCASLVVFVLFQLAGELQAAVLRVDTENAACDDLRGEPFCTLAAAIVAANHDSAPDTIQLVEGYIYSLRTIDHREEDGNGLPAVASDVTIEGNRAVIERSQAPGVPDFRLLRVTSSGRLHLRRVTLRYGTTRHGFDGAAIWNLGELTLEEVLIKENRSGDDGGGVRNDGVLKVMASTFHRNYAGGRGGAGGALFNIDVGGEGRAEIEGSTFYGNEAGASGGAIWNGGRLDLSNCTVSANRSIKTGGGIQNNGTLQVNSSTFTKNESTLSGGGIRTFGPVRIANTILAHNWSPVGTDCQGQLSSLGYNLIRNLDSCRLSGDIDSNLYGEDPQLGPLQDNGGPTRTHALSAGSVAIDAGRPGNPSSDSACATTDQRGQERLPERRARRCDIGAFEVVP